MRTAVMMLLLFPALAWTEPFVCFTEAPTPGLYQLAAWNPSCESIEAVSTGLEATALVFSGAGLGLACTGIGLTAALWLEGAALGAQVLNLVVGQLPCDNSMRDAEIKQLAEVVVCEELAKMGIRCSMQRN